MKVSLSKDKFASRAFRDAYEGTVLSGGLQPGEKYFLKQFKQEQAMGVEELFHSIENHTRKMQLEQSSLFWYATYIPDLFCTVQQFCWLLLQFVFCRKVIVFFVIKNIDIN